MADYIKPHSDIQTDKHSPQTHVRIFKYVCLDLRKKSTKGGQRVQKHPVYYVLQRKVGADKNKPICQTVVVPFVNQLITVPTTSQQCCYFLLTYCTYYFTDLTTKLLLRKLCFIICFHYCCLFAHLIDPIQFRGSMAIVGKIDFGILRECLFMVS